MATTYTLIQAVTVGSGGAANIEFTSIPQTYTDLLYKISARMSVATGSVFLRFNGTTTDGKTLWMDGDGTSLTGNLDSSNQYGPVHGVNGNNLTASTFGSADIYISNYTSNKHKSSNTDGVTESNSATGVTMACGGSRWANTAAITSIQLVSAAPGNFSEHSTAYLYGISNA